MSKISCRACEAPSCKGCNIYRLAEALHKGKFKALMNDNRCIQIDADVKPLMRGEWVYPRLDSEMCSCCGTRFYISALFAVGGNDEPNFCPNCGADMREANDE